MAGGRGEGWDDLWAQKGPDADCPVCPMKGPWAVGTRRDRRGLLFLNPHAAQEHAPRGGFCAASKQAVELTPTGWALATPEAKPS